MQEKFAEIMHNLKFNQDGLIPVIAQDFNSKKVLMLAWMNKIALEETIKTGYATYFSRSRNELWKKGATSGNLQKIFSIKTDCDYDTILLEVDQTGCACHTGAPNCFFNKIL
jgi:phosphoribosyl-AMP cyclohydrolase